MNKPPFHPAFQQLFTDLNNHAVLTSAGLDSEEASEIVFNRLRTEDVYHSTFRNSAVSNCCNAIVQYHSANHAYCSSCGNFCNVVPNDTAAITNGN